MHDKNIFLVRLINDILVSLIEPKLKQNISVGKCLGELAGVQVSMLAI